MNEATLRITASSVTAAHAWIEPQSWATRCTWSTPRLSITAPISETSCGKRYPERLAGLDDSPAPRTS